MQSLAIVSFSPVALPSTGGALQVTGHPFVPSGIYIIRLGQLDVAATFVNSRMLTCDVPATAASDTRELAMTVIWENPPSSSMPVEANAPHKLLIYTACPGEPPCGGKGKCVVGTCACDRGYSGIGCLELVLRPAIDPVHLPNGTLLRASVCEGAAMSSDSY